jgi:hypothetical protein
MCNLGLAARCKHPKCVIHQYLVEHYDCVWKETTSCVSELGQNPEIEIETKRKNGEIVNSVSVAWLGLLNVNLEVLAFGFVEVCGVMNWVEDRICLGGKKKKRIAASQVWVERHVTYHHLFIYLLRIICTECEKLLPGSSLIVITRYILVCWTVYRILLSEFS